MFPLRCSLNSKSMNTLFSRKCENKNQEIFSWLILPIWDRYLEIKVIAMYWSLFWLYIPSLLPHKFYLKIVLLRLLLNLCTSLLNPAKDSSLRLLKLCKGLGITFLETAFYFGFYVVDPPIFPALPIWLFVFSFLWLLFSWNHVLNLVVLDSSLFLCLFAFLIFFIVSNVHL